MKFLWQKSFDEVQTKLSSEHLKPFFPQNIRHIFYILNICKLRSVVVQPSRRHLSSRMNGKEKLGDSLTVHLVLIIICEYKLRW